jgi:hypothetical protein
MKRAVIPAMLLLCAAGADAGVAVLDAVSSCPSITKTVITGDSLLWGEIWIPSESTVIDTFIVADEDTVLSDSSTIDTAVTADKYADGDTLRPDMSAIDTVIIEKEAARSEPSTDNAAEEVGWRPPGRIKFGRRAAFNHSQVTGARARLYSHDGESFSYTEYRNKASFGIGFEVAGIIGVVLSDAASLNFSPGVVVRKPFNTSVVGISEVAVSFPVLMEWAPFRFLPLRLYGGIMAGVPVYASVKWNDEGNKAFKERAAADFGLAAGAGVYVSDRAFVDVRGILGLSGYDRAGERRLNQLAVGVNYIK